MSWIQQMEEEQYDTQTEYLNVLRQEAYDPYEYFVTCEEHDQSFDIRTGDCTDCPESEPAEDLYFPDLQKEYEMPF